jgi:ADP-heptose:LPS heptosyltransferase
MMAKDIRYQKILIINLGGIGDVLLSTPALRALKGRFPEAGISMLVVSRAYEVLSGLPYIAEINVLHLKAACWFRDLMTLAALRKKHFDLAVNMRTLVSASSAKKIKLMLDMINPKLKAGRDTEGRGHFFNIRVPESDLGDQYEMEYDLETVRALGAEVSDKGVDFNIAASDFETVDAILAGRGVAKGDTLIGVHPGGKLSHRWPLKNFSKVINAINQHCSCKFAVTGDKDETVLARKLTKMSDAGAINLAGELNLKELGAFIKRCTLFISNDTGSMHIAAILGAPLVAIFGPGYITRYDPRNISRKAAVLYNKAACAPCNKVRCRHLKCMTGILPESVITAAMELLINKL